MSSLLMKMTHFRWCKVVFFITVSIVEYIQSLEDITGNIFGSQNTGVLFAFGDFNGDKHADIYVISQTGKSVSVFLASNEDAYQEVVLLDGGDIGADHMIVSVVPADFDADAQMDLLVVTETVGTADSLVAVKIYWGDASKLKLNDPLVLPSMVDQPLLLDSNADMVPDLMGEVSPGDRRYWNFISGARNYTEKKIQKDGLAPLRRPQSSAFVDLDNDLTADMCVVSTAADGTTTQLEFWYNKDGVLTWDEKPVTVTYESDLKVVGQFVFADIDGDQTTDIFVPVCTDVDCAQSFILLYFNNEKWIKLPVGLVNGGHTWNFIPPAAIADRANLTLPITMRVGDFNLDGFPDLLAILGNATGNMHRAVVLENVGCGDGCGGFSRTFAVNWGLWLEQHDDLALVATFFDILDDGILDVLVTSVSATSAITTQARRHDFVDDACFIKVMVLSGLCNNDCPNGREPYGVNQPGPVVRYTMADLHGNPQKHAATQLCQSAYLPLQLPYTVFGLGQTPNFVDKLQVGIPRNSSHARQREWTSVIPNSQLVIIPYPVDDPSSWTNKMFVMPSRLMMLTGAALLGTCGFIAGILAILHWRDKIEDRKEKRQEAQRFHFDAM